MKKDTDKIVLNAIAYIFIGVMALLAVIPFIVLISSSLQAEKSILKYGYSFVPTDFSLDSYKYIFAYPDKIFRAYGVSIFITAAGTSISLFVSSMTAYVLARKDVKYRNGMAFFLFFTTLFNAGLLPYYLLVSKYLKLKDTVIILILTGMVNVMYVLILRTNIINTIPDSISESAKIDGANDFKIYTIIILPLLKPALASVGLFVSLGYWNDWASAMLFIQKDTLYPLQYVLYKILSYANFSQSLLSKEGAAISYIETPTETVKLALTVVATGPIVLAYPFAQKYFIAGITIGAVKG